MDRTEDFFNKFRPLFERKPKSKNFVIDLRKVSFIYPNVLFFLIALRETFKDKSVRFAVEVSDGGDCYEYLDYAGFCKEFGITPFPEDADRKLVMDANVFHLENITSLTNYSLKSVELVDFLKRSQDMSAQVETEVIASIEEVLRNILQHSSSDKSFLIGQTYPTSGRVRFVFYDNGLGIKRHMTQAPYDDMHPVFKKHVARDKYQAIKDSASNLAIVEASRYGVSATNYNDNSGAGLNFLIKDLCSVSNGVVTIISEDGIVIWKGGSSIPFYNNSLPYKIKGTLVSLDLDCHSGTRLVHKNEL